MSTLCVCVLLQYKITHTTFLKCSFGQWNNALPPKRNQLLRGCTVCARRLFFTRSLNRARLYRFSFRRSILSFSHSIVPSFRRSLNLSPIFFLKFLPKTKKSFKYGSPFYGGHIHKKMCDFLIFVVPVFH